MNLQGGEDLSIHANHLKSQFRCAWLGVRSQGSPAANKFWSISRAAPCWYNLRGGGSSIFFDRAEFGGFQCVG